MGRILGLLTIGVLGFALTVLLAVGFLLLAFFLKKQISHMDEERWDAYFHSLSLRGLVCRSLVSFVPAVVLSTLAVYGALRLFHFSHLAELTLLFAALAVLYIGGKLVIHRKSLLEKLRILQK